MSANSKQDLLDELAKGDSMRRWGAVLALGRDAVNRGLQSNFVEAFTDSGVLQPISGEFYIDPGTRTEKVAFENLTLGPTQLSFQGASGSGPQVRVRMELIAGNCVSSTFMIGNVNRLRRSHALEMGMGYQFEVYGRLKVQAHEHLDRNLVVLDLSEADNPTCTLGFSSTAANAMGKFILEQLRQQGVLARQIPVLAFDIFGRNGLSTSRIEVVAQQAPAGGGGGTSPVDDGALLVLMQLVAGVEAGQPGSPLPYLLPRKTDKDNYASALLISRLRAPIAKARPSVALEQLVLPDAYQVVLEQEEHNPHDMIVFGDVRASSYSRQLLPNIARVSAGNEVRFDVGATVSRWSAADVYHPQNSGEMEGAKYTAPSVHTFPAQQRLVKITGSLASGNGEVSRSSLLVVSTEQLAVSPRVVIWAKGDDPVRLTASEGGRLEWALEGDAFGSIQRDPEGDQNTPHALFTPAPPTDNSPIRLQRIRVRNWGEEEGYATVIILDKIAPWEVQPFHVSTLPADGKVSFSMPELPEEPAATTLETAWDDHPVVQSTRWVLYGEGELDAENGQYTAPEQSTGQASVVAGIYGGQAGIAVIEHHAGSPREMALSKQRWISLQHFYVSLNNTSRKVALANGRQQVGIDIEIKTDLVETEVGPVPIPISDAELATLVLTHRDGTRIDWLPVGTESLKTDGRKWVGNKARNRFDYYPVALAAPSTVLEDDQATRRVTVYLQTTQAEVTHIRAEFRGHDNQVHRSYDKSKERGQVELEGRVVEPLTEADIEVFKGKRIREQGGFDKERKDGTLDIHNYWHYTTDYWLLKGIRRRFVDVLFDQISMAKWESELLDEAFCSYVGTAYFPRALPGQRPVGGRMEYQAELELLAIQQAGTPLDRVIKQSEIPAEGAVLFVIERVADMKFWYDHNGVRWREGLGEPMQLTLIDNYGSAHTLKVRWGRKNNDGSIDSSDVRNFLHFEIISA